jgi:hypothetical protein
VAEPAVEVVTLTPEALAQFFHEASTGVEGIADAVARAAGLFRANASKPANDALAALPGELREFIVLITVIDGQIAAAPRAWAVDDLTPPEQVTRLGHWLESLIEAQTNDDPLTVADILEYDLEPLLRSWQALLTRCHAQQEIGALASV